MTYGIQGWRTTQRVMQGVDSLFTTRLGYYNPHYGSRQSYTGNITESDWHHRSQPYQSYTYEYDGLNRLRTTRQYTNGAISDAYSEYPQYYDLNGNPKMLYRTSSGAQLHNFTYTYTGNQLTTLSDGSATYSYTYDTRGNMTRDGYHNLNLSYNHLNLLEKVTQNGSTVANYSYLSDGTKLSSVNSSGVGFVYRGSLVYGRSGNTLALESCGFGGGRLISASGSSTPHYYVTDHLGSVRVVLNNSGDIVSQHDYYPFGKSHDNPNLQTSPNRYLFNGKESQTFANVPYLDYGARMYDADVLPWLTQDPLLQNYLRFSPYVFCAGNPVRYVDKDGRKIYLATGVSKEFKQKFAATIKFMNAKGTSGNIAALEKSKDVYYINEVGKIEDVNFNPATKTINWDPNHMVQTDKGMLMSPATVLAHEADHAQKYDEVVTKKDNTTTQKYNESRVEGSDSQYEKKEERRVITGSEQDAARKHGEINNNQTTRDNYGGKQATGTVSNMTPAETSNYIYENNNQYINN